MSFFNNGNKGGGLPIIPAIQQLGQLSNAMANPQQALLDMMMGQNPVMKQVLNMAGGKSPAQLEKAARELLKSNGVDITSLIPQAQAMAKQFGIKL